MSTSKRVFGDFSVGDYVVFERSYDSADFAAFATLSGDNNPLHHDAGFAARSGFERPIVPLHLTLAPLSMVAGMVFPGEPSLYLGHEVRAVGPVFYDESIRYSARIESVNASHRVLSLRVLGLRGTEVVLDAAMRVQARVGEWDAVPALTIRKGAQPACALVTGATGEIGSAVAHALGRQGWRLLLQDRGPDERRRLLKESLERHRFDAEFAAAELSSASGRAALSKALSRRDDIALIVHSASPPVDATAESLVAVNFSALGAAVDAVLPAMLARQGGAVVLIGSSATEYSRRGWEAYAGAKSMAANLIDGLDRGYRGYGIRGFTMMPGLVATRFSEAFRGDAPALLPQEVAEAVVRTLLDSQRSENVVMLEPGREVHGRLGFHTGNSTEPASETTAKGGEAAAESGSRAPLPEGESRVAGVVRRALGLPADVSLKDAALGVTPGWDSLKHIELLLGIESALGIRFGSGEMEEVQRFCALEALCRKKLSETVHK